MRGEAALIGLAGIVVLAAADRPIVEIMMGLLLMGSSIIVAATTRR